MGFRIVMAGLIFIFFNINLGPVNLLPDLIGYFLLFQGMASVLRKMDSSYFSTVKTSSQILMSLSLLELLIKHTQPLNHILNNLQTMNGKVFSIFFMLTMTSLLVYCLFNLCKGIEKKAAEKEEIELSSKAHSVFQMYLVYQIILSVFLLAGLMLGEKTLRLEGSIPVIMFIGLALMILYVSIRLLSLLNEAEKIFSKSDYLDL